jgi:hypothetical protein
MTMEVLEMEYDDDDDYDDDEVEEMIGLVTSEKSSLHKVSAREGSVNCSKQAVAAIFIATIVLLAGFLSSILNPSETIDV